MKIDLGYVLNNADDNVDDNAGGNGDHNDTNHTRITMGDTSDTVSLILVILLICFFTHCCCTLVKDPSLMYDTSKKHSCGKHSCGNDNGYERSPYSSPYDPYAGGTPWDSGLY